MKQREEQRLLELLADRATQGLTEPEQVECERLLASHPDVDAESLERVAALLDLVLAPAVDVPLPATLRSRLEADAARRFG